MLIAITGCSGFVGSHLLARLGSLNVVGIGRNEVEGVHSFFERDIISNTDYSDCFMGVDCLIHTAARAHVMKDEVPDPLSEYRKVNVEGTINLAHQAAKAGVKRFIFISSIKVNGEKTLPGKPFSSDDPAAPEDAYGRSKLEAEQKLLSLAHKTGMEIVVIRPPLVYGPGVKGNFASMIKLIAKGLPLPLGAIDNRRSLVGVDNLVDLIVTCIEHPAAVNQVFIAGDGKDLSTTDLLRGVANAMGKNPRLMPVPATLLMLAAKLMGKKQVAIRLLGSLQVDISKARELLGWEPPVTLEEGLRRCFLPQGK